MMMMIKLRSQVITLRSQVNKLRSEVVKLRSQVIKLRTLKKELLPCHRNISFSRNKEPHPTAK